MIESSDESRAQPEPVRLNYLGPVSREHDSFLLQAAVMVVTLAHLGAGAALALFVLGGWWASWNENAVASALAAILIGCGVLLCIRNGWGWKWSYNALIGSGIFFAAAAAWSSAVLRRYPELDRADTWLPLMLLGGAFGVLDFCGAFLLCRVKAIYSFERDTRGRERFCLVMIPTILVLSFVAVVASR